LPAILLTRATTKPPEIGHTPPIQPLHFRWHQPAIFVAPSVVCLNRNAGLPAHLLDRRAILSLFENERDLLLAKSGRFHTEIPLFGDCQT
jgi:hypothetical protein